MCYLDEAVDAREEDEDDEAAAAELENTSRKHKQTPFQKGSSPHS